MILSPGGAILATDENLCALKLWLPGVDDLSSDDMFQAWTVGPQGSNRRDT